jgi:hypothetical protein
MATGKRGGRGIKDRNVGSSAGIRPYKLDLAYASPAAFLTAKSLDGENSSSAEAGDLFYNSTSGSLELHNGTSFQSPGAGSKSVHIVGAHCTPVCSIKAGGAATGADTTETNVFLGKDYPQMVIYNTGTNTTRIAPQTVVDANCTDGLYLPSTDTDNVGCQINFGAAMPDLAATTGAPSCFTVGTDPAFFMEVKLGIPDISDYDMLFVGFVEPAAAYVATAAMTTPAHLTAAYDEKAGIGIDDTSGTIVTYTSLAGSDVKTDLAATAWADDAVKTLKVLVSAAGAVTYTIDGSADASAVAFSFADATVVTPMIIAVKGAAAADTPPIIEYIKYGHQ